jgi:hypothetical protein
MRYWDAGCRHLSIRIGAVQYEGQIPVLLEEVMPRLREAIAARAA